MVYSVGERPNIFWVRGVHVAVVMVVVVGHRVEVAHQGPVAAGGAVGEVRHGVVVVEYFMLASHSLSQTSSHRVHSPAPVLNTVFCMNSTEEDKHDLEAQIDVDVTYLEILLWWCFFVIGWKSLALDLKLY